MKYKILSNKWEELSFKDQATLLEMIDLKFDAKSVIFINTIYERYR